MATLFLIIYNIFFLILLIPFAVLILIFSGKYRKELFYKLSERFGFWKYIPFSNSKKTVWIHCSSLGEVRAAEPVILRLKDKCNIVLTTVTKTGREYALKTAIADFAALVPLDFYPFINRVFNLVKPDILILVETELWASMLYAAGSKKIKIITINGRMSVKSFKFYGKMKFFWKYFAGYINILLARNDDDAERFSLLVGKNTKVSVSGNIKYDRVFNSGVLKSSFGFCDEDKIFTAGSIRETETAFMADSYIKIKETFPEIIFFVAPRHLSKLYAVKKILDEKKINYALFSEISETENKDKKFILLDVFGKLQSIYEISDICFVGGSLVDKGGQNPIEPAACAKPVLFGKYMDNFKFESETLLKYGGAITVLNSQDIAEETVKLLSDKVSASAVGENALKAVQSQKGAIDITVKTIEEQLN